MEYFEKKPMVNRYEQVFCFSREEMERRFGVMRQVMKEQGTDVTLILEGFWEGYSQWLTGNRNPFVVIVPKEGKITAVFGEKLLKKGEALSKDLKLERKTDYLMPEPVHPDIEYVYGFSGYEVNALLEQYQNYRLGFIHLEAMSADMENYLKEAAPKAEFVDIALALDAVKGVKSPEEMALIRNAVSIHEKVMKAMPSIIRPGRTVRQINMEARYLMHQLGSGTEECLAFALQFGNDRKGPLCHHSGLVTYPERALERGDRIFMLLECNGIGGHFTALGRNFCLGEPDPEIVKYWELCLKMQDFAAERLKTGAVIKEIFDENVKYIESLGYKTNRQNYLHSLGYVLGEKPYLHDPSETIPLRENMVYLNHPHVRIDRGEDTGKVVYDDLYAIDTYKITPEGGVRQNKIPRELIVIE